MKRSRGRAVFGQRPLRLEAWACLVVNAVANRKSIGRRPRSRSADGKSIGPWPRSRSANGKSIGPRRRSRSADGKSIGPRRRSRSADEESAGEVRKLEPNRWTCVTAPVGASPSPTRLAQTLCGRSIASTKMRTSAARMSARTAASYGRIDVPSMFAASNLRSLRPPSGTSPPPAGGGTIVRESSESSAEASLGGAAHPPWAHAAAVHQAASTRSPRARTSRARAHAQVSFHRVPPGAHRQELTAFSDAPTTCWSLFAEDLTKAQTGMAYLSFEFVINERTVPRQGRTRARAQRSAMGPPPWSRAPRPARSSRQHPPTVAAPPAAPYRPVLAPRDRVAPAPKREFPTRAPRARSPLARFASCARGCSGHARPALATCQPARRRSP